METTNPQRALLICGFALLGSGAAWAQHEVSRAELPRPEDVATPRARLQHAALPDVDVIAHTGQRFRFYTDLVKDKKVMINFFYAQCDGICVPVTSRLIKVQKQLGDRVGRDIFFYSITLKPELDSPEKLAEFAAMHGAGPGWLFLTGEPSNLERLRLAMGFFDLDPAVDADKSNHAGMIRYGIESEMRWGSCPGQSDPNHILKSMLWDLEPPRLVEIVEE